MNNSIKISSESLDLLIELERDSSLAFSELSRRLRVPQETVRYRLRALFERNAITSLFTFIDLGKIGISVHKLLIKLRSVDERRVQSIIEHFEKLSNVNWIARFDGPYDIAVTVCMRSQAEYAQFVDDLKARYHRHIKRLLLSVNIGLEIFPREFRTAPRKEDRAKIVYTTPKEQSLIDEIDEKILQCIAVNPRMVNTEIASSLDTTSETVGRRRARMEKIGIIRGYGVAINCEAVGLLNYYFFISLQFVSQKAVDRFIEFCRRDYRVHYIIKALGEWDYEMNVEVTSVQEYRTLVMELNNEFSEIIEDLVTLPVQGIHKFQILTKPTTSR